MADLGKVILDDISGSTVSRCELKCGAALIADAQLFMEIMKHSMQDQRNTGFGIFLHSYRQDATNGRDKVVALELHSSYVSNFQEDGENDLSWGHFCHLKRLADLGVVGDESGAGCVGITLRGLKSLGCPSWRELRDQGHMEKLAENNREVRVCFAVLVCFDVICVRLSVVSGCCCFPLNTHYLI